MEKKTTVNKKEPSVKRKRRRISRFHLVVTLFVAILVLGGATVFMLLFMPGTSSNDRPAVFAVKSVEVVGDTRYSREAIIGVSGIKVGQSVFSVDKQEAIERIRESFPYIDYIDIGHSSFDTVTIQVRETEVLGARYAGGYWYVVGANGRAVEELPVESDRPPRYLYFKGVTPGECTLGGQAMDERSMGIVEALLDAFEETAAAAEVNDKLMDLTTGIVEIDMTDKSDIRLNWNNRVTVALGNETNLSHKIAVVSTTLPLVLEGHGALTEGVLDLRSYSDEKSDNDMAVYTPQELLTTTPAEPGTTDPTGTGTTEPSGTATAPSSTAPNSAGTTLPAA